MDEALPPTGRTIRALRCARLKAPGRCRPIVLAATGLAVLLLLPGGAVWAQGAAPEATWDRDALEATCEANAQTEADRSTCLDIVRRVLAPEPASASEEMAFTPIKLRGKGDKIVRFDKPEGVTAIVDVSYTGKGIFDVAATDGDGILNAWLVQERGKYQGRVLLDSTPPQDQLCVAICEDDDSTRFEITAGGRWAIRVAPLTSAREWPTAEPLTGDGDDVVRLDAPVTGHTTTAVLSAGADAGLLVWPYGMDDGVRLLDDTPRTDRLRAGSEVFLPDGTALLQIRADGPWSLAPLG